VPPLLHRQAEAGGLRWAHRPVRAPLRQAQVEGQLSPSALSTEQRAALVAAKLRALVTEHDRVEHLEVTGFPGGAAARSTRGDPRAWFLAETSPERGLGPALTWAARHDIAELHVIAESGTGTLARRAAHFDPAPTVWRLEGRTWLPAEPEAPADPGAVPAPSTAEFALLLASTGVDVVQEHGEVSGEVLGLQVARVVVDEGGGASLEVGVGRHDREAFAMVHGELPDRDALASVVDTVRTHRRPGATGHPLSRLAPERWLRARVVADPALVGCTRLAPVPPPLPRTSVKEVAAASAVGEDAEGHPVLVTCSVGIDLDLVPTAADARALHAPGARLLLAVPERDDHPLLHRVADRLAEPAEVVAVPGEWRAGVVASS